MNLNPNYWASYDMMATVPGSANLVVSIYDKDNLNSHDLIGSTMIDVENRWFNPEWRSYPIKPVERRTLHLPSSALSQGKIEMWVDILTPGEAKELPMVDIKPPPPEGFELRVVVWETRNVPLHAKAIEGKVDMQVSCNFIGWESIAGTASGATAIRHDYAIGVGEIADQMEKRVKAAGQAVFAEMVAEMATGRRSRSISASSWRDLGSFGSSGDPSQAKDDEGLGHRLRQPRFREAHRRALVRAISASFSANLAAL